MKFGGTSVKDAGRIRGMIDIVGSEDLSQGLVVVCSAMKGVTDDLIRAAHDAAAGLDAYTEVFDAIRLRHHKAVFDLLPEESANTTWAGIESQLLELQEILHGVYLIRECSLRTQDLVMSFGERLNNQVCAAYACTKNMKATYVDARLLIVTDDAYGNGMVDFTESYQRISRYFEQLWAGGSKNQLAFVAGFIAATKDGITTTLGRNGSDYSASILGAGLNVQDIEIWTDVDGVLSCDPRLVKQAFVIDDLSVEEAMEMSYFGAEVLHPYTMIPAVEKNIPLWIKNTMNPAVRGTKIAKECGQSRHDVTGLAVVKDVALINVVGGGMIGTRGTASRIFAALLKAGTNVIMISQASSEHSISIVVKKNEANHAVTVLRHELTSAIQGRLIQAVELVPALDIVSIIGASMKGKPGVSGRLFTALGNSRINILAIAQGSSEMNISCVIEAKDREQALNSIHQAFFPEAHA